MGRIAIEVAKNLTEISKNNTRKEYFSTELWFGSLNLKSKWRQCPAPLRIVLNYQYKKWNISHLRSVVFVRSDERRWKKIHNVHWWLFILLKLVSLFIVMPINGVWYDQTPPLLHHDDFAVSKSFIVAICFVWPSCRSAQENKTVFFSIIILSYMLHISGRLHLAIYRKHQFYNWCG